LSHPAQRGGTAAIVCGAPSVARRGDARRGALLQRYDIYTSQMAKWRLRRDQSDDTWRTQPVVGFLNLQAGRPPLDLDGLVSA